METIQAWIETTLASGSLLIYPAVFVAGLLASFTPCTYPVLPLTVGYIGGSAGNSKGHAFILSLTLVSGLAIVYAIVGTIFAALGTPLGVLAGNGYVMTGIALFFMLMALFLLDVFSFPTPHWMSSLQSKRRSGMGGAFVTGAVSGLVVGPCTGPILFAVIAFVVTTLEQAATTGGYIFQILNCGLLLFIFGIGQGALILICSTSAGMLKRLPKAGKWMVSLKKGFALIILLGAAFLLLHTGATTGFNPLGDLLVSAENEIHENEGNSSRENQITEEEAQPVGPKGDEFFD